MAQTLSRAPASLRPNVRHFIEHVSGTASLLEPAVATTIDGVVQRTVQGIVDARLDALADRRVGNAAAVVVDHVTDEVIAWVVGGAGRAAHRGNALNAVTSKRQPGSTLKPFVYALALERGWTAATMLDDAPLEEQVGHGLHAFRNYSRRHYGPVNVREALGNSLNIPAVHAIRFVGGERFMTFLAAAGVDGLDRHPAVYGDGLALGSGEVSLLELVEAYAVLARMGTHRPLRVLTRRGRLRESRLLPDGIASLVGDILSDPHARAKEFGRHSILDFPYETAGEDGNVERSSRRVDRRIQRSLRRRDVDGQSRLWPDRRNHGIGRSGRRRTRDRRVAEPAPATSRHCSAVPRSCCARSAATRADPRTASARLATNGSSTASPPRPIATRGRRVCAARRRV